MTIRDDKDLPEILDRYCGSDDFPQTIDHVYSMGFNDGLSARYGIAEFSQCDSDDSQDAIKHVYDTGFDAGLRMLYGMPESLTVDSSNLLLSDIDSCATNSPDYPSYDAFGASINNFDNSDGLSCQALEFSSTCNNDENQ